MKRLQIRETGSHGDKYDFELHLDLDGATWEASASVNLAIKPADLEDIRWYLEEYPEIPYQPEKEIARRIEANLEKLGIDLFHHVFEVDPHAMRLWGAVYDHLEHTRVEVHTEPGFPATVPWELMRDSFSKRPLAIQAAQFVRSHRRGVRAFRPVDTKSQAIRILLVICRPGGSGDVAFRSVASRLIKGLPHDVREFVDLDVLRPPTYERLVEVLQAAHHDERPYHVVHFDGHGAFLDLAEFFEEWEKQDASELMRQLAEVLQFDPHRYSPTIIYPKTPAAGKHGYLVFENPKHAHNRRLVDAADFGSLLNNTGVPVLVLNACRSAYAEAREKPEPSDDAKADTHSQVHALGSFAQQVMDAGVGGVIAMRYNVYVVTAAEFVANLYRQLADGRGLGESVTMARQKLHADPVREIGPIPVQHQDWIVPVVYEAAPITIFPKRNTAGGPNIQLSAGDSASTEVGWLDDRLPRPPDVGFFGRDETLLALDRAFDSESIVLLHAYAGSGKTSTAAEFARWYSLTGGTNGPVPFTSFETYTPLPRVLDKIGKVFGRMLEQREKPIHWLTLDDAARRALALELLTQYQVLWIWDNVEPINGLNEDDTTYTPDERQALADFLRDAKETHAKFLLTSRRDERDWLGDLTRRIEVPPMPMQERVQLARGLAKRHGRELTDVDDWRPLLRFTQGNPLTITVLVGQALRDGLQTREQIEAFVDRVRVGEAAFDDEAEQGRTRSLGASLQYGFDNAFTEDERRVLALLAMFQGFVDVDVLKAMGNPDAEWSLPELHSTTRESLIALLDRAADGLLSSHGGGYYMIHPALPWFFSSMFIGVYKPQSAGPNPQLRAFVGAMSEFGNYYHRQYQAGNRDVIAALSAEEANLLHARRLGRMHGWWYQLIGAMQGLDQLYDHTGRRAEWRRLVEEIVPDFMDLPGDGPFPDREEEWSLVADYRVRLAREARQWDEAERIQRVRVDWDRRRAEAVSGISLQPDDLRKLEAYAKLQDLDSERRNTMHSFAASLHGLGEIQRYLQQSACVASYEESLAISEAINDRAGTATCAFNLGTAYKNLVDIRDLAQAERWYRRSLKLREERDRLGQGRCLAQIGGVAFARVGESRRANEPRAESAIHVKEALQSYHQALRLLPADAVKDLAVAHNQLGAIYSAIGDSDRALHHSRESIRLEEQQGNLYGAAQTRYNIAIDLASAKRLSDAREYARSALRGFESYGDSAATDIATAQGLLAEIEQSIQEQQT